MTRTKIVNGVVEELTTEEQTALEAQEKAWRDANPEPTPLELLLGNLRNKRNQLLAQTDYLALSDQTMTAEMTAYRQALRDITNGLTTVEQVDAVVWPEKPEV